MSNPTVNSTCNQAGNLRLKVLCGASRKAFQGASNVIVCGIPIEPKTMPKMMQKFERLNSGPGNRFIN